MKPKLFKFHRRVIDGETFSIEADTLAEAVEILKSGDCEAETMCLESLPFVHVDIFDGDCNLTSEEYPEPQKIEGQGGRAMIACTGLELPDDVTPGALAGVVSVSRELSQAYEETGHGIGSHVDRLDAALETLESVSKHADEPRPTDDQIREEYAASDDPDAVLRKYKLGSLDELGPVSPPEAGKPVSIDDLFARLAHPREVGSAEYREIYEMMSGNAKDLGEARSIVTEFMAQAQGVLDLIDGKKGVSES